MAYQMYPNTNFYIQDLQGMKERIDNQIRQIQQNQMQQQPQIPQPITQNFQLAPNPTNNDLESKYANNIDEVKNTFVIKTGLFIDKDFTTLWVKDVTGKRKTFTLQEVIEIDEKDKEIIELRKQIEEMKGVIANEYSNNDVNEPATTKKPSRVSNSSKPNAK